MLKALNRRARGAVLVCWLLLFLGRGMPLPAQTPGPITSLKQLTQALASERRLNRNVRLEVTVCAASRPEVGVLVVQDETGVELLEVGNFERQIVPGERVLIKGWYCLLRKRELGIELSATPLVDNDGLHMRRTWPGLTMLKAGPIPVRLEWFNCLRDLSLEVSCTVSNGLQQQEVSVTNFCHEVVDKVSSQTNLLPGLEAKCYEGYWETIPDFELLQPVKTGVVTNLDPNFRTRDEMVGIRFTGWFNAPSDGLYTFRVRSDEGSLLFLGKPELPVASLGLTNVPPASPGFPGEKMSSLSERRWTTVEGRVSFVSRKGRGLAFELRTDQDVLPVRVADASGLDSTALLNAQVRVTGLSRGVLTADQRVVLGAVFAASAREVVLLEPPFAQGELRLPITSVERVQSLRIEHARRALPVRIRGVVTDARNSAYERWMSIQDDTRGIFVHLTAVTNALPLCGEFWEVVGHSGAGDFAPVVVADRMTFLGEGLLPEPARPTWRELVNGSRDVQWAELEGLVTEVESNKVTLLLPEGRLDVQMDRYNEAELKPFQKTVARIRGVLYAIWNADTREVRVGNVVMRNATISVAAPAPAAPFDAPVKTPRELFLFDPQASAFQRIKIRGQVVHAAPKRIFVMDGESGLRIWPAETDEVRAGDWVEAVGYPEISGPSPLLREAFVRKTGAAALPPARAVGATQLLDRGLDSTRVLVNATLVGLHSEPGSLVLELQSDHRLFLARLDAGKKAPSFQVGSRLALTGVYVGQGSDRRSGSELPSFELLLNSPADITVLSTPSWWTLQRLLTAVGLLLVVLLLAAAWITLLRRKVEQRTAQLQQEIRERERMERQHALEAERSRIARDLHDDLGSSLTEIGVLANTGQRANTDEASFPALFQAIAGKARGLIAALDVIVWAVDPEDNSLQSLADYLSGFADEYLSHSGISCRLKVPVTLPPVTLDGQIRHGLLMVVKETLNNIVRHADATEVEFRMAVADQVLNIVITDNGKGFEGPTERDGHGLKNLSARLSKLGGSCQVVSSLRNGTTVTISLPVAVPAAQ